MPFDGPRDERITGKIFRIGSTVFGKINYDYDKKCIL